MLSDSILLVKDVDDTSPLIFILSGVINHVLKGVL